MNYEIYTILNKSDIIQCPTFTVDKYNWGGEYRPITYGKMAYIKDKGLFIQMTCEEENPLTAYAENEDPVFLDSAMEAFLELAPDTKKGTYVNIEVNSNGAMLNRYGQVPPGRRVFTDFTKGECICIPHKEEGSWSVDIHISNQYIKDLFGIESYQPGDTIRCNFYKICGSKIETEHYGSYTLIDQPSWNFHLPEFFADAVFV